MPPPCQSHHFCNPAKKGLKASKKFSGGGGGGGGWLNQI